MPAPIIGSVKQIVGDGTVVDESDLERTEPASQRRLEQAREEGHLPQSRELTAFLVLASGAGGVWIMGTWLSGRIAAIVRDGLTLDRKAAFNADVMGTRLLGLATEALITLLPLLAALVVAAVVGPLLLGARGFAPKAISPDFSRIDPLKGLRRIVSIQGAAELAKAIAKSLLIVGVAAWVVWHEHETLLGLVTQPVELGMTAFARMVLFAALATASGLALIAGADVPFQLWQYHSKLRMTKEEVRQEAKEMEGDPQVKARIRSQQREMARRRMMSEVPKADVVVTNPTHYAVALRYVADRDSAPRVIAKGVGNVAQKIREIAAEHQLPVLEAPALARALHRHTEIGEAIPGALYTAVAQVMAWVYQVNAYLKRGGLPPVVPREIQVPEGLDPGAH